MRMDLFCPFLSGITRTEGRNPTAALLELQYTIHIYHFHFEPVEVYSFAKQVYNMCTSSKMIIQTSPSHQPTK